MKWPLVPTAVTVLGVPALIGLGVWQLDRREEKRGDLAAFARPQTATIACERWTKPQQRAGRSSDDQAGFALVAECRTSGGSVRVNLGWSADLLPAAPVPPRVVRGTLYVAPGGSRLLIADPPLQPLARSQQPSAATIPNNHLLYAVQWFFFAGALGVVYALWLRRWRRDAAAPGTVA